MPSILVSFDSSCNCELENVVFKLKNTNMERAWAKTHEPTPKLIQNVAKIRFYVISQEQQFQWRRFWYRSIPLAILN